MMAVLLFLLLFLLCTLMVLSKSRCPWSNLYSNVTAVGSHRAVLPLAGLNDGAAFDLLGNEQLEVVASLSTPAEGRTSFWGEVAETERRRVEGGTRRNRRARIRRCPLRFCDERHRAGTEVRQSIFAVLCWDWWLDMTWAALLLHLANVHTASSRSHTHWNNIWIMIKKDLNLHGARNSANLDCGNFLAIRLEMMVWWLNVAIKWSKEDCHLTKARIILCNFCCCLTLTYIFQLFIYDTNTNWYKLIPTFAVVKCTNSGYFSLLSYPAAGC